MKYILIGAILLVVLLSQMPAFQASPAAIVLSPFTYVFNVNGTLEEAGSMNDSTSPYWWVNSGAYLYLADGLGKTVAGELPTLNKWRVIYAASNPVDTDNGYHPQNIFRLVTRSKWQNFRQEAYFKIKRDNLSASTNRNSSNGLLLFDRYQDGNNLYYVGIRVDGAAVIKKKKNNSYYTLGYKKVFAGTYNKDSNPNLLPKNTWIGLRSETVNNPNGSVTIKLFMDNGRTGVWTQLLSVQDGGRGNGGAIITEGYGGIRTDFMDVEFDDYRATKL